MREIPKNSTDVLYSAFPLDDMKKAGEALGVSNINVITTACLKPQRALYHSCVNNIQARLKNASWDETVQGTIIADRADFIYDLVKDKFAGELASSQIELKRKRHLLAKFTHQLEEEEKYPWDAKSFDARWPVTDMQRFPHRWQRKAIETYRAVKENIAKGTYVPSDGWDAVHVARWWSERNLEYKHYRDIARDLVNEELARQYPAEAFLEYKPTDTRTTVFVTAGMGGGKSKFTQAYLDTLDEDTKRNIVLHDADYMKLAFARSAMRDGIIKEYTGTEVQNESSNALYENTIKRRYFSCRIKAAPHVIINSTIAGSFELDDGLAEGGKVVIHHMSIDYPDAVHATEERAKIMYRKVEPESVRWSCRVSPQNLLGLFEKYPGKPITVHLYERTDGDPVPFGTMDVQAKTITLNDTDAFLRLAARAELKPERAQAQKAYIETLLQQGVTIRGVDGKHTPQPIWTLTPQKILKLASGDGNDRSAGAAAIKTFAEKIEVGDIRFPSPTAHKQTR